MVIVFDRILTSGCLFKTTGGVGGVSLTKMACFSVPLRCLGALCKGVSHFK